MIDNKTKDDLVRFIIESENGFCSQTMSIENIKKCERWIDDIADIHRHNESVSKHFDTPAQFNQAVRKAVWREAFGLNSLTQGEVATLVIEELGERDIFDSSFQIFQRKRGEILPEKFDVSEDSMDSRLYARKNLSRAEGVFVDQFGSQGYRYHDKIGEAYDDFRNQGGWSEPWMYVGKQAMSIYETEAGSVPVLDENGQPEYDQTGAPKLRPRNHMIIVKAPMTLDRYKQIKKDTPTSELVKMAYRKAAIEEMGTKVDSCSFAMLHPGNGLVFKHDVPKSELSKIDELVPLIKNVCNSFWNDCVLKGIAPTFERSTNFQQFSDFDSDAGRSVVHTAGKIPVLSKLKNLCEQRIKEAKEELLIAAARAGVSLDDSMDYDKKGDFKGSTDLGMVKISRKREEVFDHEAIFAEFKKKGGDPESVKQDGYDKDKLMEAAKLLDIDLSQFRTFKFTDRFTPNKSKNSQFSSMVKHFEECAIETVADVGDEVADILSEQFGAPQKKFELEASTPTNSAANPTPAPEVKKASEFDPTF